MIEPALTPKEWVDALAGKRPDLYRADEFGDEFAPPGASERAAYAAAALCLHGRITWEMVDALRWCSGAAIPAALGMPADRNYSTRCNAVADLLESLLPPRES